MEFKITKRQLERGFGSCSLEGMLLEQNNLQPTPQHITLLFEQSSFEKRRINRGPDEFIVNENTIYCLAESIVNLCNQGKKLTIGEYCPE